MSYKSKESEEVDEEVNQRGISSKQFGIPNSM